jgi:hypothetical protein
MCEDCDAVPVRFVAYFNKPGGKVWRPAQKQATAWAIDIRPSEAEPAPRAFVCDDPQVRLSPVVMGERMSQAREGEGAFGDSEFVESAPHPDPLPASGEREKAEGALGDFVLVENAPHPDPLRASGEGEKMRSRDAFDGMVD